MSQRVLIGIQPHADLGGLKKQLVSFGAESVNDPSSVQPDVVVATVPSQNEATNFIEKVKKLPGVRYAELDAWRFTT